MLDEDCYFRRRLIACDCLRGLFGDKNKRGSSMKKWATGATIIAALMAAPTIAPASTVDWATWSNVVTGATAGSATGTTADTTFTYTGELQQFIAGYPSYTPTATFSGGTVANPPPMANGIIRIIGGGAVPTDTITFATSVTNPVFAIWSLGQPGTTASFNFNQPFTIESGGPSTEYGGSTITSSSGNIVSGIRGQRNDSIRRDLQVDFVDQSDARRLVWLHCGDSRGSPRAINLGHAASWLYGSRLRSLSTEYQDGATRRRLTSRL